MPKMNEAKMAKTLETLEKDFRKLLDRFNKFEKFEDSWEKEQVQLRKKMNHEIEMRLAKLEAKAK